MRVIAGCFKKRRLITVPGTDITRPTADRVKESLFNILMGEIPRKVVLDLFAGSGALGIEALSRGAQKVVFVDNNAAAIRCLCQNLSTLEVDPASFAVFHSDVDEFLRNPTGQNRATGQANPAAEKFDIILADPPYASPWYNQSLKALDNSDLCANAACLILEMDRSREHAPPTARDGQKWELRDERIYGTVKLQFWQRETRTTNES